MSSRDLNEGRQLKLMQAVSIYPSNTFIDKQNGKSFNREQYQLLKRRYVKDISFTYLR